MLLDEELHSVCNVLEEPREDAETHPRAVSDTVDCFVLGSISETVVEPLVECSDWASKSEWKHVPPSACSNAVLSDPKGTESSCCATAIVHTSNGFSLNPENCKLREEQQQEYDVDDCKCSYTKGDSGGTFLKRSSFKKRSDGLVSKTLLSNKEAS